MRIAPFAIPAIRDRWRAYKRDRENRRSFGPDAPLYGELIWVVPADIHFALQKGPPRRHDSGRVLAGDWDLGGVPLASDPKIAYSLKHFRDGLDWEACGAVAYLESIIAAKGSADGCRNRADIDQRFAELDRIYESTAASGALLPATVARPGSFRECGGILIHIGRDGRPIFGLGGHHRLGIALAQQLDVIPAQLGSIHPDGLAALANFRSKSKTDAKVE